MATEQKELFRYVVQTASEALDLMKQGAPVVSYRRQNFEQVVYARLPEELKARLENAKNDVHSELGDIVLSADALEEGVAVLSTGTHAYVRLPKAAEATTFQQLVKERRNHQVFENNFCPTCGQCIQRAGACWKCGNYGDNSA